MSSKLENSSYILDQNKDGKIDQSEFSSFKNLVESKSSVADKKEIISSVESQINADLGLKNSLKDQIISSIIDGNLSKTEIQSLISLSKGLFGNEFVDQINENKSVIDNFNQSIIKVFSKVEGFSDQEINGLLDKFGSQINSILFDESYPQNAKEKFVNNLNDTVEQLNKIDKDSISSLRELRESMSFGLESGKSDKFYMKKIVENILGNMLSVVNIAFQRLYKDEKIINGKTEFHKETQDNYINSINELNQKYGLSFDPFLNNAKSMKHYFVDYIIDNLDRSDIRADHVSFELNRSLQIGGLNGGMDNLGEVNLIIEGERKSIDLNKLASDYFDIGSEFMDNQFEGFTKLKGKVNQESFLGIGGDSLDFDYDKLSDIYGLNDEKINNMDFAELTILMRSLLGIVLTPMGGYDDLRMAIAGIDVDGTMKSDLGVAFSALTGVLDISMVGGGVALLMKSKKGVQLLSKLNKVLDNLKNIDNIKLLAENEKLVGILDQVKGVVPGVKGLLNSVNEYKSSLSEKVAGVVKSEKVSGIADLFKSGIKKAEDFQGVNDFDKLNKIFTVDRATELSAKAEKLPDGSPQFYYRTISVQELNALVDGGISKTKLSMSDLSGITKEDVIKLKHVYDIDIRRVLNTDDPEKRLQFLMEDNHIDALRDAHIQFDRVFDQVSPFKSMNPGGLYYGGNEGEFVIKIVNKGNNDIKISPDDFEKEALQIGDLSIDNIVDVQPSKSIDSSLYQKANFDQFLTSKQLKEHNNYERAGGNENWDSRLMDMIPQKYNSLPEDSREYNRVIKDYDKLEEWYEQGVNNIDNLLRDNKLLYFSKFSKNIPERLKDLNPLAWINKDGTISFNMKHLEEKGINITFKGGSDKEGKGGDVLFNGMEVKDFAKQNPEILDYLKSLKSHEVTHRILEKGVNGDPIQMVRFTEGAVTYGYNQEKICQIIDGSLKVPDNVRLGLEGELSKIFGTDFKLSQDFVRRFDAKAISKGGSFERLQEASMGSTEVIYQSVDGRLVFDSSIQFESGLMKLDLISGLNIRDVLRNEETLNKFFDSMIEVSRFFELNINKFESKDVVVSEGQQVKQIENYMKFLKELYNKLGVTDKQILKGVYNDGLKKSMDKIIKDLNERNLEWRRQQVSRGVGS